MSDFDPNQIRYHFPALYETDDHGQTMVYFDGPGGTQTPQSVIDAITAYLTRRNANTHAPFTTSARTDDTLTAAHTAFADLINAPRSDEIVFGPNMTTLTFALSRALARAWEPGDEVIVTRLDHDANIAPWLALEEQGMLVRWLDFDPADCTLRLEQLDGLLNERTRLLAVGGASNAVGTVNPLAELGRRAHEAGALLFVDAVHLAPHYPIDVQALDCDFLACSAYKFYGPHVGMLWGRYELLDSIPAYKVRPSDSQPPGKWMTGTQNHEGLAGATAAIEYLAWLGGRYGEAWEGEYGEFSGRRLALKKGLAAIAEHEQELFARLLDGLEAIPAATVYGITDRERLGERTPTAAIRLGEQPPLELCEQLGRKGIATYAGHMYALEVIGGLGLEEKGGVLRIGISHYNTEEEIDALLELLEDWGRGA